MTENTSWDVPTWHNASVPKCKMVFDILAKLFNVKRDLPEGYDPATLQSVPMKELLDYGQRILRNDTFWESLPEIVVPSAESIARVERAAKHLVMTTPKVQAILDSMIASSRKVFIKTSLREELRRVLNECH